MWKNYITTAIRNILRHKTFSILNILGLAIGLATCMLILLFVRDELSYDQWIPDGERIANLEITFNIPGREPLKFANSPGPVGPALIEYFPSEIEAYTRLYDTGTTITHNDNNFSERASYVDSTFFDVFDLNMIAGDRQRAVTDNLSLLLSEDMAQKYFGNQSAIGQTLTIDTQYDYTVVGVFENLPEQTHLDIDFIAYLDSARYQNQPFVMETWTSANLKNYIKFRSVESMESVQSAMPDFIDARAQFGPAGEIANASPSDLMELRIMPVRDIYLKSGVPGYDKALGSQTTVITFATVAVLVLVIATINFMNLATAKSLSRAREVSVRKVLGANRKQLVQQFLSEAVLTTLSALLLAIIVVELTLPAFNNFLSKDVQLNILGDPAQTIGLVSLAIFVGVLGGSYPAFITSSYRPARVLRSNKSSSSGSGFLRQGLVVLQFTISIALLISTTIVYAQTVYLRNVDLGFEEEQRLAIIGMTRGDTELVANTIRTEMLALPEIISASFSSDTIPQNSNNNIMVEIPNSGLDPMPIETMTWGYGFAETMGIEVLAGRAFSEDFPSDVRRSPENPEETGSGSVMVNETFLGKAGFASPEEAVGKIVRIGGIPGNATQADEMIIIGVIRDMRTRSARETISPMIYDLSDEPLSVLTLTVETENIAGTLSRLEDIWNRLAPDFPFNSRFVEEGLDALYEAEEERGQMFAAFSLFAILVACLGLYGLASYSAAQRTKEIGIRKVMGASVTNIVRLLVWQFSKPVVLANIIAWPLAFYFVRDWLNGFTYRIDIGLMPFIGAGLIAILIAWATVAFHAWAVARTNPVKALRYE